jgi:NAD(P)-dependent dehydrogenase (short-subunit alcohol dehydrogenase family)
MKLKNRGVVITGASQGLGRAIAESCIREGAHVVLCARGKSLLAQTCAELSTLADSGQQVIGQPADVSNPEDLHLLFETARNRLPSIEGLVNNAGVYGPKGLIEDTGREEWWKAIEINFRATVDACVAVLPIFRKQGYGKIVNLSGGGATAPLPRFSAYAASKAAVVRFTETLAEETADAGIDVNAIAPGALNTRLLDEVLSEEPATVGADFYQRALKQKTDGGASLEKAAQLCTFLLSGASDGISGRLLSAVWDPWQKLPNHLEELRKSDVYTLRRIVPADREVNWE